MTDIANCGKCGEICGGINGKASCVDGQCVLACEAGFKDCDGVAANGCEAQLAADPKHCGVCGHDCLGGACKDSACQPFTLTNDIVASKIILHDGFVYAGTKEAPDYSGGYVARVPMAGGAAEILDSQPQHTGWFDVDDQGIYWTANGIIFFMKHDGGDKKALLSDAKARGSLSVFGDKVAWVGQNSLDGKEFFQVLSANKDGSNLSVYTGSTLEFKTVLIDETFVYWDRFDIVWYMIDGGGYGEQHWSNVGARMFALDGPKQEDFVYVVIMQSKTSDQLWKCDKQTQGMCSFFAELSLPTLSALAFDTGHMYWAESGYDGRIMRGRKETTNTSPEIIAASVHLPSCLAVDDKAVYWGSLGSSSEPGGIYKVAKPPVP